MTNMLTVMFNSIEFIVALMTVKKNMHRAVYFDTSSRLLDLEQIAINRLLIL